MPAKGKSKVSMSTRAKVLQSKLAGKTVVQTAAETGLAPSTVQNIVISAEAAMVVARARVQMSGKIGRLLELILDTLIDDLGAAKTPADRLKLRTEAYNVIMRGEPQLQQPQVAVPGIGGATGGSFTLTELLLSVRQQQANLGGPPAHTNGHSTNGHGVIDAK